jgi:PAS domain S-box-containing protein
MSQLNFPAAIEVLTLCVLVCLALALTSATRPYRRGGGFLRAPSRRSGIVATLSVAATAEPGLHVPVGELFEHAPDAIIVTDGQGRIQLVNRAAETMFRYARRELVGKRMTALLPADSAARYLEHLDELRRQRPEQRDVFRVAARRADGHEFPVECSVSWGAAPGKGGHITAVLRDASERMRERQLLISAHRDVVRLSERALERVAHDFDESFLFAMEERQAQIARELHDSVGGSLTAISLLLHAARNLADPQVLPLLERTQSYIAHTSLEIRKIARGILPTGDGPGALLPALEQLAHELSVDREVKCRVRGRGDFAHVPASTGTHVHRILQEAASNAIRHGAATELRIRLMAAGSGFRAVLSDNGRGCDPKALGGHRAGMGIRSMHARARLIGGRVEIAPRPGGGCRVQVSWGHDPQSDAAEGDQS